MVACPLSSVATSLATHAHPTTHRLPGTQTLLFERLCKRFSVRAVCQVALGFGAVGTAFMVAIGPIYAFLLITAFVAATNGLVLPAFRLIAVSVSDGAHGTVLGMRMTAVSLARIVGPMVMGYFYDYAAVTVDGHTMPHVLPYWVGAGALFVGTLLLFGLSAHVSGGYGSKEVGVGLEGQPDWVVLELVG